MARSESRPDPHSSASLRRILVMAALLVPLATGLLLSWHSMGTLDVWLHNRIGDGILAGEGVPRTNTFSYVDPDHPWTNHEWLFQTLVAAVGPEAGEPIAAGVERWNGLRLLLCGALLLVLFLGDGGLRRIRDPETGWGWSWLALPLLLGMMLLWPRLILRPELLSYLLFVLLVRSLDRPLVRWTSDGTWRDLVDPRRPIGGAFLITVLWSQIHGFSALAPVLLVLAAVIWWLRPVTGRSASSRRPRGRWWLFAVPWLLVALCLSPNGIQGLIYPLRALSQFRGSDVDMRATIGELTPLLETRNSLAWTLLAYKVSLVWGLVWIVLTWRRTSLYRIVLWAAAAVAAFTLSRNLGFYALTFILLHTGTTGFSRVPPLPRRLRRLPRPALGAAGIATALVLAVPWWVQITNDGFYLAEGVLRRFGGGANVGRYPEGAADALRANAGRRIFTSIGGAAFLLDRAEARVFIDGRTEAYPADTWLTYNRIQTGDANGLALLDADGPDGVFLNAGKLIAVAAHPETAGQRSMGPHALRRIGIPVRAGYPGGCGDERPVPERPARPQRDAARRPGRGPVSGLGQRHACSGIAGGEDEAIRRGLEFHPDHPPLLHNQGNRHLAREEYAEALPYFQRAFGKNSRLASSAQNAGVCLIRLGRFAEARRILSRATRIDPGSFAAWTNLGSACLALGDAGAGRRALERAARLRPQDPRIREMLQQIR